MELNTASSVISLAREMEETSARFYESLAGQYPASEEMFTGYAKENRKFIKQFETAYYGVITDAIEGCYAFNIDPDKYSSIPNWPSARLSPRPLARLWK